MTKEEKLQDIINRMQNGVKYIEAPSEWEDLIIECHEELVKIDPNYTIFQIKEKFGGLRYYFDSDTEHYEKMREVVYKYEKASFSTPYRH